MILRKHVLKEINWPTFEETALFPGTSVQELESRIERTRTIMEERELTHLIVYGDREHFANLAYLTGFDPRFEEALLIVAKTRKPLLLIGNECEGYLPISPLYNEGKIRTERFQPFSLLNQPRNDSRFIRDIFIGEGINNKSKIGSVGWKYFSTLEHPQGKYTIEIPAYIVDTLRELSSTEGVLNTTDIFMDPDHGLRTFCSASEIAYFEYTNILASEGMKRMIFGLQDGMIDYDLAKLSEYNGLPSGCHMTIKTGDSRGIGLASPSGGIVRLGEPLSMNICYWGSNISRAGWSVTSDRELPEEARDYVDDFAGIYFSVMAEWFSRMRIGTSGGGIWELIQNNLPFDKFRIFLNPGHLIHFDEWVSSPIYPGSNVPIHSGMMMQVDVIPSSENYFSTRMEDGIVIADKELRSQIRTKYPDCFSRCQKRREFMIKVLGIEVSEEVLPLSNIPALVPPYFLNPQKVFSLEE